MNDYITEEFLIAWLFLFTLGAFFVSNLSNGKKIIIGYILLAIIVTLLTLGSFYIRNFYFS